MTPAVWTDIGLSLVGKELGSSPKRGALVL